MINPFDNSIRGAPVRVANSSSLNGCSGKIETYNVAYAEGNYTVRLDDGRRMILPARELVRVGTALIIGRPIR